MLNVRDANEEFEMKTGCLRRKSLDFHMDKEKASSGGSGHKRRNINNLLEVEHEQ